MTVEIPKFTAMPKMPRLSREIIITEKIDGTNASIFIGDDFETIMAGSRTRWITPTDDNFGFAKWVDTNKVTLIEKLGPGHHFGEWYGSGINRGYGLKEKRFALFNVSRWNAETKPEICDVVPILWQSNFDTVVINETLNELKRTGSQMVPGYMNPEGIVVFHVPSRYLFKKTFDDAHKGNE